MEIALDPLECAYVGGLFAACVGLWRNKRVHHRRATGEDPEVLSQATRPTQRYFAQMVRVLAAGLALLLLGHAAGVVWPGLLRLPALDVRWVDHAGFALGVLGLGLCALAQRTMGSAWRVGIDEVRRTPLVEFGIFAHIRNPTYTGPERSPQILREFVARREFTERERC